MTPTVLVMEDERSTRRLVNDFSRGATMRPSSRKEISAGMGGQRH